MAVNPRGRDVNRLLREGDEGPFVMLNLLRFVEGGRDAYCAYVRAFRPFLEKYGAELLYVGDGSTAVISEEGQAWDAVMLVRYPSRAVFRQLLADDAYQQVTHLRTMALKEAVLQATVPWSVWESGDDLDPSDEGDVLLG